MRQTRSRGALTLLIIGILLVATNLRASFTGVGSVLSFISTELGLSPGVAGAVTTLPLLGFAVVSPLAPALSRRLGVERALLAALLTLALGTVLRSVPTLSTVALFLGTAIIGAAIAVGNVLLPTLIKRDFPNSISMLTGAYTLIMGAFAALSSGTVVPIATHLPGGWRTALGCWVLLTLLAIAVWLPQVRGQARGEASAEPAPVVRLPWRSPLAWVVTLYMGLQSLTFYVLVAWLPSVLQDNGMSPTMAGWHLFFMQTVALVMNLAVPLVMRRLPDQRLIAGLTSTIGLIACLGLLLLPGWASLWTVVAGLSTGSSIVLALSFLSLRAPDAASATALSGMAQSIGYLIAAVGPVLLGTLHSLSGGWIVPLTALCLAAAAQVVTAVIAGRGLITTQHAPARTARLAG
ncbi:CP family cyanate transporter-like MFS transporter [Tamaricihabitans halophyticus]|uniref:CP family cyanate transporter-like MFS transporter n=1 Tax=Tamaricihabitans halophyticus TaxID=1262583 RepID=A0A4R2RDN2_9PSEU|nr:MFS transporter [Tamaricihabitans halophyticus]TCP57515.1 CP family cyanate transporter-like MFS transporter [Tamaricihabitans halophyticus]